MEKIDKKSFKVPEGYFDSFTSRMMSRIDEETARSGKEINIQSSRSSRSRLWTVVAAAVVALLVVIGTVTFFHYGDNENSASLAQKTDSESVADEYLDEAMEYTMMDENDMYMYMASAE